VAQIRQAGGTDLSGRRAAGLCVGLLRADLERRRAASAGQPRVEAALCRAAAATRGSDPERRSGPSGDPLYSHLCVKNLLPVTDFCEK
jgi:hypothetical protein